MQVRCVSGGSECNRVWQFESAPEVVLAPVFPAQIELACSPVDVSPKRIARRTQISLQKQYENEYMIESS